MVLHKWIGFSPVEASSDGAMDRIFNMHYLCVCVRVCVWGGGWGGSRYGIGWVVRCFVMLSTS